MEGGKYRGAKATINAWKPEVQQLDEFSSSQILILGDVSGVGINAIEAGWQVYVLLFFNITFSFRHMRNIKLLIIFIFTK